MRKKNFSLLFLIFIFFSFISVSDAAKQTKVLNTHINPYLGCLASRLELSSPTSIWYTKATMTVTNNCTEPQTLHQAIVSFKSNSNNVTKMWGGKNTSSPFSYANNVARTVLNIVVGDPLPVGKSLIMYVGINLTGKVFDLVSANNSLLVIPKNQTPSNGEIDVTVVPTNVVGITDASEIDITGLGLPQPYVIKNTNWSAPTTYKVTALPYGTYTITALPIGTSFTGVATPSTVSLTNATPVNVKVTYQPVAAIGSLQISLGQAPMQGLATSIDAKLVDITANQNQVFNINWGGTKLISSLPAGHNYEVIFPQVTNGIYLSNPTPITNPVILQSRTTTLNVTYQTPESVPSQSVIFNISGLTSGATGMLTITDSFGNKFQQNISANGQIMQGLPVNDSFVVTATVSNMQSQITPSSFTLKSDTSPPTVNVQLSSGSPPINLSNFYAYADTSLQSANNGLTPPKGGNMVEAFVKYNSITGKSDLAGIKQGDNISQLIKNTSNTVASIGGSTGPYPWDFQSPQRAIADIEALIDYYHFIGIDFDVEGAALQNTCVQDWVAQVAFQIRKDRPSLLITLTVPDPVNGFTTSTIDIIKKTLSLNGNKMLFNWINKLNFDEDSYNGCTQTTTNMDNNCLVISATTAEKQLAALLGINTAYQYIGEIFMIPIDDKGNSLSLTLANQVATTLKSKGVTHMGYWRLQNDTPDLSYGNMYTRVLGLS